MPLSAEFISGRSFICRSAYISLNYDETITMAFIACKETKGCFIMGRKRTIQRFGPSPGLKYVTVTEITHCLMCVFVHLCQCSFRKNG